MMLNLDRNKKYLLACSYGPDSMALFFLLLKDNYDFDVAIVNYNLRQESTAEVNGLKVFCDKHHKHLFVLEVKETISRNVEAKCREIRYKFFSDLYKKNHYEAVLVAHNEDDHLETYLLQKKRKNLPLFYGINDKTSVNGVPILRPLLHYKKRDLQKLCDDNKVPYAIDSTNLEITFERNKIRHNIIAKMNDEDRAKLLEQIDIENTILFNMLDNLKTIDQNVENILKLNEIEFCYFLNTKLQEIGCFKAITYKQSLEVRKILESKKANIILNINKDFYLEKSYGKLFFKSSNNLDGFVYIMDKPSIIDCEFFYADFTGDTKNRNVAFDSYPITIRNAKPSDTYQIKNYTVKVNRLFIDWKMPLSLRKRWPVIVDKSGKVIYIPRFRKDFIPENTTNFYVKECFTFQ